jgi:hypothetical protein
MYTLLDIQFMILQMVKTGRDMQLEIDYDNTSNFIEVRRWKDPKPLPRAQVYKLNMETEELSML